MEIEPQTIMFITIINRETTIENTNKEDRLDMNYPSKAYVKELIA